MAEAKRRVWEQRSGIRLVVAGSGPAARLVPDDDRVSLASRYIPESEVEELFAEASLMVLPYTQASQSGVGALAIPGLGPLIAAGPLYMVRSVPEQV